MHLCFAKRFVFVHTEPVEGLGEVQGCARVVAGARTDAHLRQVGAAQIRLQRLLLQVSTSPEEHCGV